MQSATAPAGLMALFCTHCTACRIWVRLVEGVLLKTFTE